MATGRQHAIEDLLAHARWVETLAHQLVRDPAVADDLAQSTLLVALRGSPQPVREPRAWLARVLKNLLRETHRRESMRPAVERREARAERLPAPDELIARAEAERTLVATVLALEPVHSEILLLHYFESVPLAEIARLEGVAPATVSERLARAHARLRRALAHDRDDERAAEWLAALAPILSRPAQVATTGASTTLVAKVLLMNTTAKLGVATLVAAVVITFLYTTRDRDAEARADEPLAVSETPKPAPTSAALAPAANDARVRAETPVTSATTTEAAPSHLETQPAAPAASGRIRGRVYGVDARPVADREVHLLHLPRGPMVNVKTAADGTFERGELAPAKYHVSTLPDEKELAAHGLKSSSGGVEWLAQTSVELVAGATLEVELGAPPAHPIRVTGRLTCGGEVAHATLQWIPGAGDGYNRAKYASTQDDGRYEVVLGEPGAYRISCILRGGGARHDETTTVPQSAEWRHDIAVPTGHIALRVTDPSGAPIPFAHVDVTPRASVPPFPYMSLSSFAAKAEEDGRFELNGLRAGTYSLAIRDDAFSKTQKFAAVEREIVVTEEALVARDAIEAASARENGVEREELVVVLTPGRTARGRVIARDGGEVKSTNVFVFDERGEPLNPLWGASAEKDGTYVLPPLLPGRYVLTGSCGNRCADAVSFTLPAEGDVQVPDLVLDRAATLFVDFQGSEPAWIDVRDPQGNCFSALLDRNMYTGAFGRSTKLASSWYLPRGNYTVRVRGAGGVLATKEVALTAGEVLTCKLSP